MGERADGDEVDAGLGNRASTVEGESTGCLEYGATRCNRHYLPQGRVAGARQVGSTAISVERLTIPYSC